MGKVPFLYSINRYANAHKCLFNLISKNNIHKWWYEKSLDISRLRLNIKDVITMIEKQNMKNGPKKHRSWQ